MIRISFQANPAQCINDSPLIISIININAYNQYNFYD